MTPPITRESPDPPVIEMKSVAVSSQAYPDRTSVEDVNWTVNRNEYWVIGGMHGAGKTDLMAMTAGLLGPLSGEYRFFGHEMPIFQDEMLPERLRLGLAFAEGQLLQHLTIRENVSLPLRYHRPETSEQEIADLLELTGLSHLANDRPATTSRSWRKRAGLARALALRPEVLLVDDPLNGLDPRHCRWWVDFLRQLSTGHKWMNGKPVTLVVTTEDLRPWRNFGAHYALLQDCRFTLLGRQDNIAGHEQPLVRELLAEH